ncbi:MAG TPA: 6-phosphogluconolactonase [Thermodesulfovibrionales bacterium]|nr:6-phosphogluconolactonase [Thermodesulfovibrionales bacterium]
MKVYILPDLEAISLKVAEIFLRLSKQYISSANRFVVALSGGTTPKRLYTLLGSDIFRNAIDWNRIHFFWVDERSVPKEDEESNYKLAYDTFLSKVPVRTPNIHRIKVEEGPEKAASEYERDMRAFFGTSGFPVFDLIILGIGEDGHTASLFPGSESLKEKARLAVPVYMQKTKSNRITLTLPVLNNADQIIFLVAGKSKSHIVRSVLVGDKERKQYPAGLINPDNDKIQWLIDQEAAGNLTEKELQQAG